MGVPNRQIGIYKITSPSGKIYIGQSWDIEKRFKKYRSLISFKKQRILYNSIRKYGYDNHIFETIATYHENITQEELDNYEVFYINYYKNKGEFLLNIKEGGRGGKLAKESVEKMLATRGKWNHSEESKRKIREARTGVKLSPERRNKMKSLKNSARIILHLETGTFYKGVKEAAYTFNLNPQVLIKRLQGRLKNNTNLIYL